MRSLSRKARLFVIGITMAGIFAFGAALFCLLGPHPKANLPVVAVLAVFCVLACFWGRQRVRLFVIGIVPAGICAFIASSCAGPGTQLLTRLPMVAMIAMICVLACLSGSRLIQWLHNRGLDQARPTSSSLITTCTSMLAGSFAFIAAMSLLAGEQQQTKLQETAVLAVFCVLACLSGSRKIVLIKVRGVEEAGSMSLGFVTTFTAMLHFGPTIGVLIGVIACASGCVYPQRRQHLYQIVFNVMLTALQAWLSGAAYSLLNPSGQLVCNLQLFAAVCASVLTYFLINTGCVALIIALCSNQSPYSVWARTFMWTSPSYFIGSAASIVTLVICDVHVLKRIFGGYLLLFAAAMITLVAWLTYRSYCMYVQRVEEKQKAIDEKQQAIEKLADLYLATIKSLALAIDAKDQYTHRHILRVQRYSVATALYMGLDGADLEGVNTGALLHDIGKLGVPEYVLLKPGRLTPDEFDKIKKHPEIGAAILDPVEFPWPVLPAVKYHHEKWDGTGYPEGLREDEIPLTARILAVADVYDALTSTRSYRGAWTHEMAIETIRKDSGSHFDPVVVEAFLHVIDGVVQEMAAEGIGPLVNRPNEKKGASSAADQAVHYIQRSSSELYALYEVAQTLSTSMGLQETLDILTRKLEAIYPGTACLFLTLEPGHEALRVRSAIGKNSEFFQSCHTLSDHSRSLRVALERQTYHGAYDPDDLLFDALVATQWEPLASALIVPIVHQGEVLGTVNIYHPNPEAFGQHDRQLLETIAERAAMAIYNGLLYDRTCSHAFTDPLTGLYNVRYFTEYVDRRCAAIHGRSEDAAVEAEQEEGHPGETRRRNSDTFALLCLDLDSFKPINDNFGHQKGDQVLGDLSRIFKETVRENDVVARYGGDEFLIVLDGAGQEEAENMVERLQQAVHDYDPGLRHSRLGDLRLGVSVGFACFPADGEDCAALLSYADSNMYADKTERKLGRMAGAAQVFRSSGDPCFSPHIFPDCLMPTDLPGGPVVTEKQEKSESDLRRAA